MWLIVIDAATKWPEVIKMNSDTTAEWTIEILQSLFSRFGLPNQIISEPVMLSPSLPVMSITNSVLTMESAEH